MKKQSNLDFFFLHGLWHVSQESIDSMVKLKFGESFKARKHLQVC